MTRLHRRFILTSLLLLILPPAILPAAAQGGPGTTDFAIRDFGACINLPDFTQATEPDAFNTVFTVPGLFSINFAEYLLPLDSLPASGDTLYAAMIALLDTVHAGDYTRITFEHDTYLSAAVEFTLDEQRMFGMIYRSLDDRLFFLFADKVEGFDMLAIGRAIFPADGDCAAVEGAAVPPVTVTEVYGHIERNTTWRGEIHVIGDVKVESGVTLTIEPGTIVRVAAHSDVQNIPLQYDGYESELQAGINTGPEVNGVGPGEPFRDENNHTSIYVFGTLDAVGTPEQMIHIVSDSPTPGIWDWNRLEIKNGILSYAHVENYRMLGGDGDFTISHSILSNAGEFAVGAGRGTVIIEHNTLFNTGHELVIACGASQAIIRDNHIGPNPGNIGIAICGDSAPLITNNVIEGTWHGIRFISPPVVSATIEDNTFINNGEDIAHIY